MTGFFVFLIWAGQSEDRSRRNADDDGFEVFFVSLAAYLLAGPLFLYLGVRRWYQASRLDSMAVALVAGLLGALVAVLTSWWWWLPCSLVMSCWGVWLTYADHRRRVGEAETEEVEVKGPRYRFS